MIVAAALFAAWQIVHLAVVLRWTDRHTRGLAYYGRPSDERRRFRQLVARHALVLAPILAVLGRAARRQFTQRAIRHGGVAGPAGACTSESFRRAAEHAPRPDDVFVVTQMRSGTTWMQHLVYQVLTRGEGDLVSEGLALNAVSPFLEADCTVSVGAAPLVGCERPMRIIKTHLPVSLCPFDRRARYIYVSRHPVACLASCADFVRGNLQGFAPDWPELARWFLSEDLMWWSTWVTHVGHWQRRAEREANVLLVRYEDLAADLAAATQQVAQLLEMEPLTALETAAIVRKCRLDMMQSQAETFEMYPPHLLQAANPFFAHGGADRVRSVPPGIARSVLDWCRREGAARQFALERLYPDLAYDRAAGDRREAPQVPQLVAG